MAVKPGNSLDTRFVSNSTEPISNGKLILLTNDLLSPLLKENQEVLEKSLEVDYDLDLSKEFRWKNYPVILLVRVMSFTTLML
jgi:hypothetical protein